MHGLIFETSVWLLAESTRLLSWVTPPRHVYSFYRTNADTNDATHIVVLFNNVKTTTTRTPKNPYHNKSGDRRPTRHCARQRSTPTHVNQHTTQISKATLLILRIEQAWSCNESKGRYFSPITHASHMSTLDVRCTRWNPAFLLDLTTWLLTLFDELYCYPLGINMLLSPADTRNTRPQTSLLSTSLIAR